MTSFKLISPSVRAAALEGVRGAPDGYVVKIEEPNRTKDQNDLMWSLLDQLAKKAEWHGMKLDKYDWKDIMASGLRKEIRLVQNYDGDGLVALGISTSRLKVKEMIMLIDLCEAWAGTHGITLVRTIPGMITVTK